MNEYLRVQASTSLQDKNARKYTLEIYFAQNFYATVNVNTTAGASGSASGGGTNNTATSGGSLTFTLTAPAAATGYHFTGWSGSGISFSAAGSLTTNATVSASTTGGPSNAATYTATANYAPNYYATVNVNTTAGASGSASGGGSKNTESSGGELSYTLTAPAAAAGYHFTGWTGSNITFGSAGSLTTSAKVKASTTGGPSNAATYTATANYAPNYYANITTKTTSGTSGTVSVTGTNNTDASGGNLTFTLTAPAANAGYHFTGWSGSGISFSSSGSLTTNATVSASTTGGPENALTYQACANYAANYYVKVNVASSPAAGGTSYVQFGSSFSGTATSIMNGDGKGWANAEETFSIKTTPASNYHFTGWTATGGTLTSTSALSTTFKAKTTSGHTGTGNPAVYNVTANYVENIYYAKLTANAEGNGTVSVDQGTKSSKSQGGEITFNITATPATGYHLVSWSVTSSATGTFGSTTALKTTFKAKASSSYDEANATSYAIKATFAKDEFNISLSAGVNSLSDASSSTAQVSLNNSSWSSSVNYTCGTASTNVNFYVKATPAAGYKFIGWSETNGSSTTVSGLGATGTYTIKSPSVEGTTTSKSLYAIFKKQYTIIINANSSSASTDRIVFTVSGPTTYKVSIPVGGSRTLKDVAPGSYTITPEGDWSWNYNISPASGTTSFNSVNSSTINFTVTSKNSQKKHAEGVNIIGY